MTAEALDRYSKGQDTTRWILLFFRWCVMGRCTKRRAFLGAVAGLTLFAASAKAAPVTFNFAGTLAFDTSFFAGDLQAGVEAAVLGALPNGTSVSGSFTVDLSAPDFNAADPAVGDYRSAVTGGALTAGGFSTGGGAQNCFLPDFDCRVGIDNDFIFIHPTVGSLDRVEVAGGFIASPTLTDEVVAQSGAVSSSPFLDFDGAPILLKAELFAVDFDIVDDDGLIDPSTVDFTSGGFVVFLPGIFNIPGTSSQPARFRFDIDDITISSTSIPLPPTLPIALGGFLMLWAFRKRS